MPSHYDALFRRLFDNPQVSSDFARNYLPAVYHAHLQEGAGAETSADDTTGGVSSGLLSWD